MRSPDKFYLAAVTPEDGGSPGEITNPGDNYEITRPEDKQNNFLYLVLSGVLLYMAWQALT